MKFLKAKFCRVQNSNDFVENIWNRPYFFPVVKLKPLVLIISGLARISELERFDILSAQKSSLDLILPLPPPKTSILTGFRRNSLYLIIEQYL